MDTFHRLVVPVDGSAAANRGIAFAAQLATSEGAVIDVCSAVDELAIMLPLAQGALCDPSITMLDYEKMATENVNAAVELLRQMGLTAHGTTLRGNPATEVDAFVRLRRADAVVLGTNGRNAIERSFLGGVTNALLRKSDVPVVTVHADDALREGPMLVAIDDSRASLAALECAIERARPIGAVLSLLHVFDESRVLTYATALGLRSRDARRKALTEAEDALDDAADRVRSAGLICATEMQFGTAAQTIIDAVDRNANSTIFIGTHGRAELAVLLLGSVADKVIRAARVPVYVVHRKRISASRSKMEHEAASAGPVVLQASET